MKAHHHRRQVSNGPVARRTSTGVRAASGARRGGASKRGAQGEPGAEHGSRVFWVMVVVGGLLTSGFVLGVRSQISTYQINQAEERLRNQMDRIASQQKFLDVEQKRALSPAATAQAGKEAGLMQLNLQRANALPTSRLAAQETAQEGATNEERDSSQARPRSATSAVRQAAYVAPAKAPVRKNAVKLAPKAAGKAPANARAAKLAMNKTQKDARPRQVARAGARR